jgi:hypothetical protein
MYIRINMNGTIILIFLQGEVKHKIWYKINFKMYGYPI